MIDRLLADITLALHALFVAFVVAGAWLALRWPRILWVQVPAAAWGAVIELAGGICPLTDLENFFMRRAGEAGYDGGFIEHHLVPVLYPAALTRDLQVGLGLAVIALKVTAWTIVARRRRAH